MKFKSAREQTGIDRLYHAGSAGASMGLAHALGALVCQAREDYPDRVNRGHKARTCGVACLLCLLMLCLSVSPPHCDACDSFHLPGIALSKAVAHRNAPLEQDSSCNGCCACCGQLVVVTPAPTMSRGCVYQDGKMPHIASDPIDTLRRHPFRPPRSPSV